MPLITCPDCGHHPVSDRVDACPKCGCPIAKTVAGADQPHLTNTSTLNRPGMTSGSLDLQISGKWRVFAASRPNRKIREQDTPSQVNIFPGEIYDFFCKIEQKADMRSLEQLAHVVPLRKLLLICRTVNLGDECFAAVSGSPYLKVLDIDATPTFEGVAALKTLTSLEELRICGEKSYGVTDEAIMQVTSLTNLKLLFLLDTSVTADGMNRLRQLLPACKVTKDEPYLL